MASIQINRGTKAEIDNTPVTDGLICFQTDDNFIYMDNGDTRKAYGGVKVIPNPQEEPTEVLRNLQIADDVYKISGGHEIEDQSGTTLTQRDKMRFTGAYSHDDSTGEVTKIDIVREMTVAQKDALTGDEVEGFQLTTDENDELPLTTDWVEYRDGQSTTDALDGLSDAIDNLTAEQVAYGNSNVKDKIDELTDTKNTTISHQTYISGSWDIKKTGYIVFLVVKDFKQNTPAGAFTMEGVIPEAYRPFIQMSYSVINKTDNSQMLVTAKPNGDITCYNYGVQLAGNRAYNDTLVWATK